MDFLSYVLNVIYVQLKYTKGNMEQIDCLTGLCYFTAVWRGGGILRLHFDLSHPGVENLSMQRISCPTRLSQGGTVEETAVVDLLKWGKKTHVDVL